MSNGKYDDCGSTSVYHLANSIHFELYALPSQSDSFSLKCKRDFGAQPHFSLLNRLCLHWLLCQIVLLLRYVCLGWLFPGCTIEGITPMQSHLTIEFNELLRLMLSSPGVIKLKAQQHSMVGATKKSRTICGIFFLAYMSIAYREWDQCQWWWPWNKYTYTQTQQNSNTNGNK